MCNFWPGLTRASAYLLLKCFYIYNTTRSRPESSVTQDINQAYTDVYNGIWQSESYSGPKQIGKRKIETKTQLQQSKKYFFISIDIVLNRPGKLLG